MIRAKVVGKKLLRDGPFGTMRYTVKQMKVREFSPTQFQRKKCKNECQKLKKKGSTVSHHWNQLVVLNHSPNGLLLSFLLFHMILFTWFLLLLALSKEQKQIPAQRRPAAQTSKQTALVAAAWQLSSSSWYWRLKEFHSSLPLYSYITPHIPDRCGRGPAAHTVARLPD